MSFSNFVKDMGNKPSAAHTIERINNDDDYKPSNCRWALMEEQRRNMCSNRLLTYRGRTQVASDWAKELGMRQDTLFMRLHRGWSHERALATPVR
jgi:hypothetical protein